MIVACSSADQPGWLELRQALWPDESASATLAEMEAFCRSPSRYAQFVAMSAVGEPQGFIELALRSDYVNGTESSPVAFLEAIYVAPAHRRQGIARALVAQAERWALSQACREFASDALLDNTHS